MGTETVWHDLLDPDEAELRAAWTDDLHPSAWERLLAPPQHDDEPRPRLESQGQYVLGVFVVPVDVPDEDRVYYQQLFVLLTRTRLVTVRKTPPDGRPFEIGMVRTACENEEVQSPGMYAYHLVDEIAERFLTLVDDMTDEIDELEEHVEEWPSAKVRTRLSDLRHDLLRIRRTLAPTRDAVRSIVDKRVDLSDGDLFPPAVEVHFADAYDKLLRAADGVELLRDLVAGVRDYHQAKVANDQNDVMKALTAVASLLLVPTLIVGVYGQNFDHIPETHWGFGYWWSWGLIAATTLVQLVIFRRLGWIGRDD